MPPTVQQWFIDGDMQNHKLNIPGACHHQIVFQRSSDGLNNPSTGMYSTAHTFCLQNSNAMYFWLRGRRVERLKYTFFMSNGRP